MLRCDVRSLVTGLWRGPAVGVAICAVALLACKEDKKTEAKPEPAKAAKESEDKPAEPKRAEPAPKSAPVPSDPALGAPSKPKFKVSGVPQIPLTRSNPPKGTEWDLGVPVNTQGANARAKQCSMYILREWLRIFCTGKVIGYEKKENFGTFQHDYYEKIVPGKFASFVLRLRQGKSPMIRICRLNNRASLFVSWPPSKDQPVHVALGHGPVCDGSDWGVGYGKKAASSKRFKEDEVEMLDPGLLEALESQRAAANACAQGITDACLFYCGEPTCD